MVLFMWQDDIMGVVRFIDACLERNPFKGSAGGKHSERGGLISPEIAGKNIMNLSPLSICHEHCRHQHNTMN